MKTNLRTEQEIMKNWKGTKPVVSICCLAYNHELYIEDALEGFLIQETDFPFEVLIHDDASTDRTAEIIREYEAAYPHIIKPIYQKENQFTKQINIDVTYQYPRINGNYIAICEGDDYWTNKQKLLKSINFLNNNPDFVACCHAVITINANNEIVTTPPFGNYKGDLNNIDDQLKYNNIPTLSIVYRKNFCENEVELIKKLSKNCKYIGDIQRKSLLLKFGKIKYLKENLGTYRWNTNGVYNFSSQKATLQWYDSFNAYLNIKNVLQYDSFKLRLMLAKSFCNLLIAAVLNNDYTYIRITMPIIYNLKLIPITIYTLLITIIKTVAKHIKKRINRYQKKQS